MSLSENAKLIYQKYYRLPGENSPTDVHKRIAKAIADNETEEKIFFNMLEENVFRPNTPCMANAGKQNEQQQLCACFLGGLTDSMDGINKLIDVAIRVYNSGGGLGIPITNLREKNALIGTTGGKASGPEAVIRIIESISEEIKAGGKHSRAANLAVIRYDHPDILDLIKLPLEDKIKKFNISIGIDKTFIDAILNNKKIEFISPKTGKTGKSINAVQLFKHITETAWKTGDPGLVFLDIINQLNPFPSLGNIETVNVCGETPNLPWTVCNLGSINISNPEFLTITNNTIDIDPKFISIVHNATKFLDNVIDKTVYVDEKFEHWTKKIRPIGLGFMGFADFLVNKGIPYSSKDALRYFKTFCKILTKESIKASIKIIRDSNKEPLIVPDNDKEHFKQLINYYTENDEEIIDLYNLYGIRNSTWTCLAPTGSISISCDCHYGWEPYFSLLWEKTLQDSGDRIKILPPTLDRMVTNLCENSFKTKDEIIIDIEKENGSVQSLKYFPEKYKQLFKTAYEIPINHKLQMQAIGQRWISQAISSTVNLPNNATPKNIFDIYIKAYELGLKGITIFRDGCKSNQVVNFKKKEDNKHITFGKTIRLNTPSGLLKIIGEYLDNKFSNDSLFEISLNLNNNNIIEKEYLSTIGELISLLLNYNVPINEITKILYNKSGDKFWSNIDKGKSYPSILCAIGTLLATNFKEFNIVTENKESDSMFLSCPECGGLMQTDNGCKSGVCIECGYSKCG